MTSRESTGEVSRSAARGWRALAERGGLAASEVNDQALELSEAAADELARGLVEWQEAAGVERLWAKDADLWTGKDEGEWLGWLTIVSELLAGSNVFEGDAQTESAVEVGSDELQGIVEFGEQLDQNQPDVESVVLLGMGGSSLGPEVLSQVLACRRQLHVLDTTAPLQIARVEEVLDLERTLFIVSSKSGGTLETRTLFDYFYSKVEAAGLDPDRSFAVVTDEGSTLAESAEKRGISRVFLGRKSIGGRYSVLSEFGLVPAAAIGIDVQRLLEAVVPMALACTGHSEPTDASKERNDAAVGNPGLVLGLALSQAAAHGRDKVTIFTDDALAPFGAWLEQLLAESTGKDGKGLIPVDREGTLAVDRYGDDRIFVFMEGRPEESGIEENDESAGRAVDEEDPSESADKEVSVTETGQLAASLSAAGHPVIHIEVHDEYGVGQEFFRWQFATAVICAELGVNPFDQPDVEASKSKTRSLADQYEREGELPALTPFVEGNTASLFADSNNEAALRRPGEGAVGEVLAAHLSRIQPGDYFALLAYMDRNAEVTEILQAMRRKVAEHFGVATSLNFGPRFLHSTGQLFKGGPNSGVFLYITHEAQDDLDIPGTELSFGVVKNAQARGDIEVIGERDRRVLRVHFRGKLIAGLQRLDGLLGRALQRLSD